MSSAQNTPIISVFHHQKRDHVFLDALLDAFPASEDAQRHQERGQDHEQHRNAVDAHLVVERPEPARFLDELEARVRLVEAGPDRDRDEERDDASSTARPSARSAWRPCSESAMNSAPANGRNVTSDRMGMPASFIVANAPGSHDEGEKWREADQHPEGVVIDVAGLQLGRLAGQPADELAVPSIVRSMTPPSPPFQKKRPMALAGRTKIKS